MAASVLHDVLLLAFHPLQSQWVSVGHESSHLSTKGESSPPFLVLYWDPANLGQRVFLLRSREPRVHFNSLPSPS